MHFLGKILLFICLLPSTSFADAPPLLVATHPQSVTKPEGGSHSFSVTATGGSGTYSYQWRVSVGGVLSNISGATSSTLTLSNLALGISGNRYSVRVSDGTSTIYSNGATLTVRPKPTVSISSSNTTLLVGDSINFTSTSAAAAGGSIVSYKWRRGGTQVGSSSTYNISAVTLSSSGTYTLVVTDNIGGTATSNSITVNVTSKDPSIIENTSIADSDQGSFEKVDVREFEKVTFRARVKGNAPLTVRWYNKSRQSSPIATQTFENPDDAEHPNQSLTRTSSFDFIPTHRDDLTNVYLTVSGHQSTSSTKSNESFIDVHHAPDIFIPPTNVNVGEETSASFRCFLGYEEDDPLADTEFRKTGRIKWYRNGVQIANSDKHQFSDESDFSLLIVRNLTLADNNAEYVCRSLDLEWDSVYKNSSPAKIRLTTFVTPDLPPCGEGQVRRDLLCVPNGVPQAPSKTLDSDGDGYSDAAESEAGSSALDAGSKPNTLGAPSYALWNGFLGMINILEVVNPGTTNSKVTVTLYTITGEVGNVQEITLPPGGQQDLILNDMPGFSRDSYGLVTVSFANKVDGRLFFYRSSPFVGGRYSFAFGIALTNPTYGRSVVGFNTMQPSTNPTQLQNSVQNWLSIVNLAKVSKSFQVSTFAADGSIIKTEKITIAPFGRIDLDGGHVVPGPSNVGLQEIIPYDASAPYIGQLIRYGSNNPPHLLATDFDFAFPLVAKPGVGEIIHLPISARFGSLNWLELANTLDETVTAHLEIKDSQGVLRNSRIVELAPFAQIHILASEYLQLEELGNATITPSNTGAVVAQSMYYFRDYTGSITSMYGSQHQEASISTIIGSYNLFLGMESYLRITNPENKSVVVTTSVNSQTEMLSEHEISIPANATVELPIHNAAKYKTQPDTYGTIRIDAGSNKVLAESLRVRRSATDLEYVAPTAVR